MSASRTEPKLLIVGCGYVGRAVASAARGAGMLPVALTRSKTRFAELEGQGIVPLQGHWLQPESLTHLPPVDFVLVAVPHRPDALAYDTNSAASDEEQTHVRGLTNLLNALPTGWRKLIYLSTTGVYGQDSPQAVTEHTPVTPTRIGPKLAVAVENWLLARHLAERAAVLRLAGIYGPGRIPLADKLRQGEPLVVPRDGYLNLIHVADIARVIVAMFERHLKHSLYLLSDGHPVLREEFYRHLAHVVGVSAPVFASPDPSSAKSRRATDKRVDPSRLLNELGIALQYPNYRSGLQQSALDSEPSSEY